MKISKRGLELIQSFESLRLKAYRCPAGIWTIGWGHTGPDVTPDLLITADHADRLLAEDVGDTERAIAPMLARPATQHQWDAMVSLAFNIGAGAFQGSTVLRKFNAGDVMGAAKTFALWNKAGVNGHKVELPGLTRRRAAEAALFLEPDQNDDPRAIFEEREAPMPQTGSIEERTAKPVLASRAGQVQAAGLGVGGIVAVLGAAEQVADKLPQLEALVAFVRFHSGTLLAIAGVAAIIFAGAAMWRQRQQGGRA